MEQDYIWNLIAKKLSGEANASEVQALEHILRQNPDLHYSMQTVIDLWNPGPDFNAEEAHLAFNRHLQRMQNLHIDFTPRNEEHKLSNEYPHHSSLKKYKKNILRATVGAIAFTGILFMAIQLLNKPVPAASMIQPEVKTVSEISTKNGSKTNVILPDGTKVWLNAGSKLTYEKNYDSSLREVSLAGEAFFDVVHNADKPFVIHTSKINIKVLGTRFNVKSYPADKTTEAALIRGSIEVSFKDRPNEKIILKPNQKIVVANDETALKTTVTKKEQKEEISEPIVAVRNLTYYQHSTDIVETSWVDNRLVFQDESFEELGRQFERWYGITMRFKNPGMDELHFTGSFRNENIVQALDALKLTAKFNYTIDGKEVTILE